MVSIKGWWADDRHFLPRIWRDFRDDRVGLYTLTYDAEMDVYRLDYVHVPRRELPPKAVHITGAGNGEWMHDLVDTGPWPSPGECTAIDYYLWMKSNAIDDALAINKRLPFFIDGKMLLIVGAAIAAVVAIWFIVFMM